MQSSDTTWLVAIIITTAIATVGWIFSKIFEFAIQLRAKIYFSQERLIFFSRQIHNPGVMNEELIRDADRELRGLASSIRSSADSVLLYGFFSLIGIVPPKKDVIEASGVLMRLHNSLVPLGLELPNDVAERNYKDYKKLGRLLKINLSTSV